MEILKDAGLFVDWRERSAIWPSRDGNREEEVNTYRHDAEVSLIETTCQLTQGRMNKRVSGGRKRDNLYIIECILCCGPEAWDVPIEVCSY